MSTAPHTAYTLGLLVKEALGTAAPASQPVAVESKLPWYAAAAGALGGARLAGKLVPKKYNFLGQMAGTLTGTALGVHGGEAVGKRIDARMKVAEDQDSPLKVLGKSMAGLAAGTTVGYLAPKGIDKALKATGHPGIPPGPVTALAPVVSGALGLAAPLMHYAISQKMREQHAKREAKDARKDS